MPIVARERSCEEKAIFYDKLSRGRAGLPDGSFSDQKSRFGYILVNRGMEDVVILCDHLEYFTAIS
jgi:hypothetical protein